VQVGIIFRFLHSRYAHYLRCQYHWLVAAKNAWLNASLYMRLYFQIHTLLINWKICMLANCVFGSFAMYFYLLILCTAQHCAVTV